MGSGREINVLLYFVGSVSIFFGNLSQEDDAFCQNKTSQLQCEETSVLTVAKEQMTVVRSSLQTVGYRPSDLAAK